MKSCTACGAVSDDRPGWLEDHEEVCLLRTVPCPCKMYGCPTVLQRCDVSKHLQNACPAAVSPCPFSGTRQCIRSKVEHNPNFYIGYDWENRQCEVRSYNNGCLDKSCVDGPLRRIDWESHFRFAHADFEMISESCPHVCAAKSWSQTSASNDTNFSEHLIFEAPPASPLHPPIQTRMAVHAYPVRNSQSSKVASNHVIQTSRHLANDQRTCSFRSRRLIPAFPKSSYQNGNISVTDYVTLFENGDLVVRILLNLPCPMMAMVACVSRLCRDSCEDNILQQRTKVVNIKWKKTIADHGRAVHWDSELEWVRPSLSPPVLGWNYQDICTGKHLKKCTLNPDLRSMDDMIVAAEALGYCHYSAVGMKTQIEETARVLRLHGLSGQDLLRGVSQEFEDRAASSDSAAVNEQLCDPAESVSRFFAAVMSEDTQTLEQLLRRGYDLNSRNGGGYDPIELARERGKHTSLAFLLKKVPVPAPR